MIIIMIIKFFFCSAGIWTWFTFSWVCIFFFILQGSYNYYKSDIETTGFWVDCRTVSPTSVEVKHCLDKKNNIPYPWHHLILLCFYKCLCKFINMICVISNRRKWGGNVIETRNAAALIGSLMMDWIWG